MIELVGFDGDDTLWHSQGYFDDAQQVFESIVASYVDLADARLHERVLAVEKGNLALYGYGAKAMALSMIETAIEVTGARISAADLGRLVQLGKDVLQHPVELLPGIRDAVEAVATAHQVVLITKGDLFHQERKVAQSGLSHLFRRIEIVSEKDVPAYARVLREFGVAPQHFAMVGNSLRSDIEPVVRLGGWGVHVPYRSTWAHELETTLAPDEPRMRAVDAPDGIAAAVAALSATAAQGTVPDRPS
jgi:putative hydrolase of the HAD superfamily